MNKVTLLLGSNVNDRLQHLSSAINMIEEVVGSVMSKSSVFETDAWGVTDQDVFYNQAINVKTDLEPLELLQRTQGIELNVGRKKRERWHEREIDIDILFYNEEIIDLPSLKIPHIHIQSRRFALEPLNEIMEFYIHPVLKKSIKNLLKSCDDNLKVKKK